MPVIFAGLEVIPTFSNNSVFLRGKGGGGGRGTNPLTPQSGPIPHSDSGGAHDPCQFTGIGVVAFVGWLEKKRLSLPAVECRSGPAWSHHVGGPCVRAELAQREAEPRDGEMGGATSRSCLRGLGSGRGDTRMQANLLDF